MVTEIMYLLRNLNNSKIHTLTDTKYNVIVKTTN